MITPMTDRITTTAIAVAIDHSQFLSRILVIAHTAIMGARIITCNPMATVICICDMSLVERVIRLDVEKLFISSSEKDCTLSNSSSRSLFERDVAIHADMQPTATDSSRLPNAHASIIRPSEYTTSMLAPSGLTISVVIVDMYPGISSSRYTMAAMSTTLSATIAQSRPPRYFSIILSHLLCIRREGPVSTRPCASSV